MSLSDSPTTRTGGPNPWLLLVIFGGALTALGLWIVFDRDVALATVAILLAVGLFINGLGELVWANDREKPWLGYLLGGVLLVGGVVVLAQPGDSLRVLAIVTGAVLIFGGLLQLAVAYLARDEIQHWGWMAGFGLVTAAVGTMAIVWPDAFIRILSLLLALRFLIVGIGSLWVGFQLREGS
jgi:uncharacterized membrane protein HdeD (DUF308 family)